MNAPAEPLVRKLFYRKNELLASLATPSFYIELLVIGTALTLAWLVAVLIRRRLTHYINAHPPKRIDAVFLTKPLALLGPLLALLYLSVAKPLANEYAENWDLTTATAQLCFAYLLAKCVLLILNASPVAWFLASVIMAFGVLDATGFLHTVIGMLKAMSVEIGQYHISVLNLVNGIIILVIVLWIAGILSRTLESYLRRSSSMSYNARELSVKFFRLFIYFAALMITLSAMGVDLTAFAVFGGALGVGIGLGLQKLTANFVSGITLLVEKSIQMGDLIEISSVTGWVRQLNIRYALIETPDGREVLIPNEELVSTRVTNWTHTNTMGRIDIPVGVAYGSDPAKVRDLLLASAREHPKCVKKDKSHEASCFLREFGDSALQFLLVFWVADVREGRLGVQSEVMMTILQKFRDNGIDIPFPQREVRMLQ